MTYELTIGLEVHIQLNTRSKLFSSSNTQYGAPANTQICPIDIALPGTLPVLNAAAVDKAILFGLSINGQINTCSHFWRKNYFYPDLPKGYQITQHKRPIIENGHLNIGLDTGETKRIHIAGAHLEEDAGKSVHSVTPSHSGIDLNRAGMPLIEVVTTPCLSSAQEAIIYLKTLHQLVRYLGICDGNLERGAFRCDANVSVKTSSSKTLGVRTEIKNLNSFRFIERAIEYEKARHIDCLQRGEVLTQETRLFDVEKEETRSMRTKESEHDYRYFPDPDLPPLEITGKHIESVRSTMPELPAAKTTRFKAIYALRPTDIAQLVSDVAVANYFEAVVKRCHDAKLAHSWVCVELMALLRKRNVSFDQCRIPAVQLGDLLCRIIDKTISGKIAKTIFEALWDSTLSVDEIIARDDLRQVTDATTIRHIVASVLSEHTEQVTQYLAGKDKVLGYLVGQAMKRSAGKANPALINQIIREQLANHDVQPKSD